MVGIVFRTSDVTKWGSGFGSDLSASQIDTNIWNLKTAIENVIANPAAAQTVISITSGGTAMTFNMSDGTSIGPIQMPVLEFHWRGDWQPTVSYDQLDIFSVAGVRLYAVQINHTSAVVFNETAVDLVSGNPIYLKMFAFAPAANIVYDIGFYYPGVLKDISSAVDRIYEEPIVRKILLPAIPTAGSFHRAYLRIAPTTAAQGFILYQGDTNIGSVSFSIGSNVGVVTVNVDTTFTANVDRLGLGRQAANDATAGGLSVVFAAQQVL